MGFVAHFIEIAWLACPGRFGQPGRLAVSVADLAHPWLNKR